MPRIFISYRRGDSIGHTGRLFDQLSRYFGASQVFMDIDTIGPGENYVEVIEKTCESCEVLLAVIGRSWISATDQDGGRRLDADGDFVRLEIAHALEKGIRVVPVLVDGAKMPEAKDLPPDLKKFALRNAWEINDKTFHQDVGNLIEALQKMHPALEASPNASGIAYRRPAPSGAKAGVPGREKQNAGGTRKIMFAGIGTVLVLAIALAAYFLWPTRPAPPNSASPPAQTQPQAQPQGQSQAQPQTPAGVPYDIPSLQANVSGPLLFFMFEPGHPPPPPGQRRYATNFHSSQSSGKRLFWEAGFNFAGQFPPPDYQIESVWYCNSKEVFRFNGKYKGSDVNMRAFHDRHGWDPPGGKLPVGQYRVDLFIAGQKITSGNFVVQP